MPFLYFRKRSKIVSEKNNNKNKKKNLIIFSIKNFIKCQNNDVPYGKNLHFINFSVKYSALTISNKLKTTVQHTIM